MTLDQATNFAEIAAAIATIATLAYLAVQIRNNNKLQKSESRRAGMSQSTMLSAAIGQSKETAELFHKGTIDYESLSPAEKVQFGFLFSILSSSVDIVFTDWQLGLIDKSYFENQSTIYIDLLQTSGGRHYWKGYSKGHAKEFQEYIINHAYDGVDPGGNVRAQSS